MNKPWTEDDIIFLKNNYESMIYKDIGAHLGRSRGAITAKILKMNLSKEIRHVRIGERFGKLIAISISGKTNAGFERFFECQCDCGNLCIVSGHSLKNGDTKSCGCYAKESTSLRFLKDPGHASWNAIYSSYRCGAKDRDLEFSLSFEDMKKICLKDCDYCGEPPRKFNTYMRANGSFMLSKCREVTETAIGQSWINASGIDRIDNHLGYTLDNCAPCCRPCNEMKRDRTKEEFLEHIKKVHNKIFGE